MSTKRHFEVVAKDGGHSETIMVTEIQEEAVRRGQQYAGENPHASIVVSEEYYDEPSRRFVGRRVWSCRGRPVEEKKTFIMSPTTGRFIVKR
jgi:hypothetical protein